MTKKFTVKSVERSPEDSATFSIIVTVEEVEGYDEFDPTDMSEITMSVIKILDILREDKS
jgi:Asp-tRNA(Asn)/Glu-tRNA(Gln) amidotransferase C subunit